jgi:hypothetical protein
VLDDEIPTALSTKGLTHKKSTFTRLDALRDLAERAIDGARIDEVERVTSRLLEDLEAVDLGVDANGSEDVELRSGRRIGRSLAATRPTSCWRWNNGSSTSLFGAARFLAHNFCPRS